jgi:hypothetical protein
MESRSYGSMHRLIFVFIPPTADAAPRCCGRQELYQGQPRILAT